MRVFHDRADAGRRLGRRVRTVVGDDSDDVVVLGLPRGGVPVAFEVAHALSAPLDVIVVRKLGAPFQPDLALGAVGEDGTLVLNDAVIRAVGVTSEDLGIIERRERNRLMRRCELLRGEDRRGAGWVQSSSSMTELPPGRRLGRRLRSPRHETALAGGGRGAGHLRRTARNCSAGTPTCWCAWSSLAGWSQSDRCTRISARSPTRRCQTCCGAPASCCGS